MREEFGLDGLAARNLIAYIEDERDAAGAVPDDRTIVVERFPDSIGDWRVCVLSPFGARVHAPWAMAVEARLAERMSADVQVLWSDDGIVIRLPESEERIPVEDLVFDPEEIEELVMRQLPATALFASVFRESVGPRLAVAASQAGAADAAVATAATLGGSARGGAKYPQFPILLEATRECLRDVFDLPALRQVMGDVRARRIRMVAGRHQRGVALRAVAPVLVDRGVHVRGRRAARRTPRSRPGPRPGPPPGASRLGGTPRADRPERAG